MGPEAKIQKAVVKWARKKYAGGLVAKKNQATFRGTNGYPDYEFFCANRHIFLIEFKAPGGQLTPLQAEKIKELRALGHVVYVISDAAEGKRSVQREMRRSGWEGIE